MTDREISWHRFPPVNCGGSFRSRGAIRALTASFWHLQKGRAASEPQSAGAGSRGGGPPAHDSRVQLAAPAARPRDFGRSPARRHPPAWQAAMQPRTRRRGRYRQGVQAIWRPSMRPRPWYGHRSGDPSVLKPMAYPCRMPVPHATRCLALASWGAPTLALERSASGVPAVSRPRRISSTSHGVMRSTLSSGAGALGCAPPASCQTNRQ